MSAPGMSSLLDLDALMPPAGTMETGKCDVVRQTIPVYPGESRSKIDRPGYRNASNGKAFGEVIPVIPVIPVKKCMEGVEADENEPGGGGPQVVFRAPFPASPSAVLLVLGWFANQPAGSVAGLADLLADLVTMPPGDQVRTWHERCQAACLDPVELLALPAPTEGSACDNCKHLDSHVGILPNDGRRRFRWACRLGYQILEFGRCTERVLIAPPECSSWERWYPGQWR